MTDTRESDEAIRDRGANRPAFSWPGRRRADEAAEAAEKAALEGLERLRGRTLAERLGDPAADARKEDREELRALVFEATQQLRDAIKVEASEISNLLKAEHEKLAQAVRALEELASELRAEEAPVESTNSVEEPAFPVNVLLDLNEASHGDLCEIGMSETQASRVIRHRDFWGDFQSVSELDHVPGFSQASRAVLDQRLVVWTDEDETAEAD